MSLTCSISLNLYWTWTYLFLPTDVITNQNLYRWVLDGESIFQRINYGFFIAEPLNYAIKINEYLSINLLYAHDLPLWYDLISIFCANTSFVLQIYRFSCVHLSGLKNDWVILPKCFVFVLHLFCRIDSKLLSVCLCARRGLHSLSASVSCRTRLKIEYPKTICCCA